MTLVSFIEKPIARNRTRVTLREQRAVDEDSTGTWEMLNCFELILSWYGFNLIHALNNNPNLCIVKPLSWNL